MVQEAANARHTVSRCLPPYVSQLNLADLKFNRRRSHVQSSLAERSDPLARYILDAVATLPNAMCPRALLRVLCPPLIKTYIFASGRQHTCIWAYSDGTAKEASKDRAPQRTPRKLPEGSLQRGRLGTDVTLHKTVNKAISCTVVKVIWKAFCRPEAGLLEMASVL